MTATAVGTYWFRWTDVPSNTEIHYQLRDVRK